MTVPERIIRSICRLLPSAMREWGEAMAQETASIERPAAAMAFALSCGAWVIREALAHILRSALLTASASADAIAPRTPLSIRAIATTCAIVATALGLFHLAEAGAPPRHVILNLTALVAGLILVLPFRRHDPSMTPFAGVVALVVGVILLLTSVLGEGSSDGRRWLSLGGVLVQPSLIGLPFLFVAFARSRDLMTSTGLTLGAIALALQPDRAMAGAMVAAIGVAALVKRDRIALMMLSVALASFIATTLRSDALSSSPFLDRVVNIPSSTSLPARLAFWGGIAILLLPPLLGVSRRRETPSAHAAFGATWLTLIATAILGDSPMPVVAYGGSAIVGYVWSILALPAQVSGVERHAPMAGSPALTPIEDDAKQPVDLSRIRASHLSAA